MNEDFTKKKKEISTMKDLLEKVTPGQWRTICDIGHYDSLSSIIAGDTLQKRPPHHRLQIEVGGYAGFIEQESNTKFIALARDLIPFLIEYFEKNEASFDKDSK